jgi:hypothetical protein
MLALQEASYSISFGQRIYSILTSRRLTILLFKVLIFLTKVYVLIQPCSPLAPNLRVVLPLLTISVLDFSFPAVKAGVSLGFTSILLVLHFMVVGIVTRTNSLCSTGFRDPLER